MTTISLPTLCGRVPDMARSSGCPRLDLAVSVHAFARDIEATRQRMGTRRSEWRRANLAAWIAEAEDRLARLAGYLPERACTHATPAEFASLDEVLPDCTCGT